MRLLAIACVAFALAFGSPAHATPAAWGAVYGPTFTPVTHVYTSGTPTETVPSGASNVNIEGWGAGAGGGDSAFTPCCGGGGGGGGYSSLSLSLSSSDWGKTFTCNIGSGGFGGNAPGQGNAGGSTTIANGTDSQTVAITDSGGSGGFAAVSGQHGSIGGAAIGGSTNTTGNFGTNGTTVVGRGGAAIVGSAGAYGAGGDGGNTPNPGANGAGGACAFTYSWLWGWVRRV